jgi:hypothetical protein
MLWLGCFGFGFHLDAIFQFSRAIVCVIVYCRQTLKNETMPRMILAVSFAIGSWTQLLHFLVAFISLRDSANPAKKLGPRLKHTF